MYKILLFIFCALFPFSLFSQGLTLSVALDEAMTYNLELKKQEQRVLQSDAYNKSMVGWFMPKISINAGYTWFNDNMEINMKMIKPALDEVAGSYGASIANDLGLASGTQEEIYNQIINGLGKLPDDNIVFDFNQFPNASVNLIQPLFTGGRIVSAKNTADVGSNIAHLQMITVKNTLSKNIVEKYFLVVFLEEVVKTKRLAVKDIGKHVQHTAKMVEKGALPKVDMLRAQVALAAAQRELEDELSRLDIARSSLNLSIGYPEDTMTLLSDSLHFKVLNINIQELQNEAKSKLPVYKLEEQKKRIAEQNYNAQRAKMMPELFAYANYSFFNNYLPVVPAPFTAGIQLRYNIFNGGSDYKKMQAGKYMINEALISEKNTEKKVNFLIDKAYKQVKASESRYLKLQSTLDLSEENYRISKKRFEQGLGRSVDVLDAYTLLESARLERLLSLYAYYVAINNLYYASGQSDKIAEVLK